MDYTVRRMTTNTLHTIQDHLVSYAGVTNVEAIRILHIIGIDRSDRCETVVRKLSHCFDREDILELTREIQCARIVMHDFEAKMERVWSVIVPDMHVILY